MEIFSTILKIKCRFKQWCLPVILLAIMNVVINDTDDLQIKPHSTIAVFAYFSNTATAKADKKHLYDLLMRLINTYKHVQFILFTTADAPAVTFLRIKIISEKPMQLPFGRAILLRKWRHMAQQAGAQTIWCFGLHSFIKTTHPVLLHLPEGETEKRLLLRYRPILVQAAKVAVTTPREQQAVVQCTGRKAADIIVVAAVPDFEPAEMETIKNDFTSGNEFFLYYGSFANHTATIRLLKAFSRFKHRQKSSWQLVLLPDEREPAALKQALQNYKYRNQVVLLSMSEAFYQLDSILAAAYAFIYPEGPVHYGRYLLHALAAGLPVIATAECKDWLQDAALYTDAASEEQWANSLMQLYKDEPLHARMAAASAERSKLFSGLHAATVLSSALGIGAE